ncbi:hypothetical protein [Paenibacillus sp. JMULE4]|uniref:nucleoside-diphosphate sugar epimerase/dehydratase n=1 Tax=Paenibacillus sp. JMULE4 TaxID=2518342 RepID=UPI0020C5F2C4|nr:hypothetical protein [Paenibacillus sp. JMULE4]
MSIVKAVFMSSVIFFTVHHLLVYYYFPTLVVPRTIYIIAGMIIILGVGGSRLLWRIARDNLNKIQPYHKKVLIVGAGNTGTMVVKELMGSSSEYFPVAFIDDDPNKNHLEICGRPVVGTRHDIPLVVERYSIDIIILAMPSASRIETNEIIGICKKQDV